MVADSVPAVAGRQHGLFLRTQAYEEGWSPYRVRRLLRIGLWVVVLGDVLAAAPTQVDEQRRAAAAALATGGVVSHGSAARPWGVPVPRADRQVHVSVPQAFHVRMPGVRLHRREVEAHHRTLLRAVPVTSRERTVVDCLAAWPELAARNLLDLALREKWLTTQVLGEHLRESVGRHGVIQLRELLAEALAGSRSEAERVLHRLLGRHGIVGWTANASLALPDGSRAIADLWFEDARLVVEVDGQAWHVSPDRFQRDRTRQNGLVLRGCTVLRFTWNDLSRHPNRVVATIRAALAAPRSRSAG